MFQQPSAGSDFRAKDHIGHLILFYPRELRKGIVTQYGTSDAISVDLVVLTDPSGPRVETGVLLFQKPLIASLRHAIGGQPVLARLGQGTPKPGQSAPYVLQPYTEQDAAFATQYLTSVGGDPFKSQAPQFTPPQQQSPAPAPQVPQVPAAPAVPGGLTPEAAAAIQALGMQVPPAPPQA